MDTKKLEKQFVDFVAEYTKVQYDRLIEEARREENLRDMAWQKERASG